MASPSIRPDRDEQTDDRKESDQVFEDTLASSTARELKDSEEKGGGSGAQDKAVRSQEEDGDWDNRVGTEDKSGLDRSRMNRAFGFAKKRGGVIGLISLLGVGGGIMAGILGPASMLINLMENITQTNDSTSTSMQRRFMKVLGYSVTGDPICQNTSKNMKCKMGRISNSALNKLKAKGFTPYFDADATNTDTRRGYPSKNPRGYTVEVDGRKVNVNAEDLTGFLNKNPKLAAKVLGTRGAFNMRLKAWTGKYIAKKFFKKFSIDRRGGLADGSAKNNKDPLKATKESLRSKIPAKKKPDTIVSRIKAKVGGRVNGAKKGGVAYAITVAGCVGVKAPGFIAAGVAAAEAAPLLPLVANVILSPGSKTKASGVDTENSVTPEEINGINSLLTEQTPRASDGKMTSALDSEYLQAAAGINSGRPAVSADFAPGYSILTNPLVRAADGFDKATEPFCNTVMSPAAMYTAMAVDSAVTVAASATVVGGIAKVIGSFAIGEVVSALTTQIIGSVAESAINDLANTDKLTGAQGEALGDALGVSAMLFFSGGGMSRLLPVLKRSQVSGYNQVKQETEAFDRQMAIASLSPFDTSSRYTFLGSIVNNIQTSLIANGGYGNVASMMLGLARLPMFSLTPSASAANFNDNYCSYAEDFGLSTGDENEPAITAAGIPCVGITPEQANMSTKDAIELVQGENWLDETKVIQDSDTIDDLLASEYIKKDTPMADYIETCGDPSEGDYLYNAASCTVDYATGSLGAYDQGYDAGQGGCSDPESGCAADPDEFSGESAPAGLNNGGSMVAAPVFLIDYQIYQSINGNDEEFAEPAQSSSESESDTTETDTTTETDSADSDPATEAFYVPELDTNRTIATTPETVPDFHATDSEFTRFIEEYQINHVAIANSRVRSMYV